MFLRWSILVLLMAAIVVSESNSAPPLDSATIAAVISPGEPGSPTETISLVKKGAKYTLEVATTGPGGKTVKEVPAATFDDVWRVVIQENIRSLIPDEVDGRVFDFGEQQVKVEWRSLSTTVSQVHHVAWAKPIKNGASVIKLQKALADLARKHAPQFKLENFPK